MISHKYRCIFVHIPKTGGTSIEDIIWPITPEGGRSEKDLWWGYIDEYHNKYQTGGLQHLLARHIRIEVGEDVFSRYFKFTIVRNPWDKAVSQFLHTRRLKKFRQFIGMKKRNGFKRYLELIRLKPHVQWEPQKKFLYADTGECLVDYIGRYEAFEDSVQHILAQIGCGETNIPYAKRSRRDPYQEYYDEESREMVAEMYADDIAAFGYDYE